jgi:hypothetical protein
MASVRTLSGEPHAQNSGRAFDVSGFMRNIGNAFSVLDGGAPYPAGVMRVVGNENLTAVAGANGSDAECGSVVAFDRRENDSGATGSRQSFCFLRRV